MSDLDEDYRRLSALDASRPSESVRRAVLEHAGRMAELRTTQENPITHGHLTAPGQPADIGSRRWWAGAKNTRWRPAAFSVLAAATIAGFLVLPRFLVPDPKPVVAAVNTTAAARDSAVAPAAALTPPSADVAPAPPRVAAADRGTLTAPAFEEKKAIEPASRRDTRRLEQHAEASPRAAAPDSLGKSKVAAGLTASEAGTAHGLTDLDAQGHTPLMLAVLIGDAQAVDALLARGADPSVADADGTTPLQAAAAHSQTAIAARLHRAVTRAAKPDAIRN